MDINDKIHELAKKQNAKKSSTRKENPINKIKAHLNKSPEQIRSRRFREAVSIINRQSIVFEFSEIGNSNYVSYYMDQKTNIEFFCALEDSVKGDVVCRIMLPFVGTEEQISRILYDSLYSNRFYGNKSDMRNVTLWGIHLTLAKSIVFDGFSNNPAEFLGDCFGDAIKLFHFCEPRMEKDEFFNLFVLHRCQSIHGYEAGFYKTFVDTLLTEIGGAAFINPPFMYYRHYKPDVDRLRNVDMMIYSILRDKQLNAVLDLARFYCDEGNEYALEELQKLAPKIKQTDHSAALELSQMMVLDDD